MRYWAPTIFVSSLACSTLAGAAEKLPSFTVDLTESSVSGLSSGAYMAGQFHVAFSSTLIGAAMIAGGPYGCARGQLPLALGQCMQTGFGAPDPVTLLAHAEDLEQQGGIDPLTNLTDSRVYVFSGTEDDTVTQAVVDQTVAFYRLAGVTEAAIRYVDDRPAGHAFITENQGSDCGITVSPFINDCDYDQAGDLLTHLYGSLDPPAAADPGRMIEFDQSEFLPDPTDHGLNDTGFVYVPTDCVAGENCRLHIVFHGCKQTTDLIGDTFRTQAGYNRWADGNRLIILYPEAHPTSANPNGCWDWWGYDDPNYATRKGRQMAAVHAMLLRLAGQRSAAPSCPDHTATNWSHWLAGRAFVCSWWWFCAAGSGDQLGFALSTTKLYEQPDGDGYARSCSG